MRQLMAVVKYMQICCSN